MTKQGPSPLHHPARAVLFAFVCSVLEFCLLRGILLFAACWSLVCSVRKFCLQRVVLLFAVCRSFCLQCAGVLFAVCESFVCSVPEFLFAVCWSFVCSVREFNLQHVILLVVVCMYFYTVSVLFAVCMR